MPTGTADLSYITELDPFRDAFMEAMNDDFNTPKAIAALFDLNREVNILLSSEQAMGRGTLSAIDGLYRDLGGKVLGIIPDEFAPDADSDVVNGLMDIVLGIRQQYREAKDWDQADTLRRQLSELGIVVDDRPDGPVWRLEQSGG
jgi:cysteinyl-tRNA synthetase